MEMVNRRRRRIKAAQLASSNAPAAQSRLIHRIEEDSNESADASSSSSESLPYEREPESDVDKDCPRIIEERKGGVEGVSPYHAGSISLD